jgi:hypothetical protein
MISEEEKANKIQAIRAKAEDIANYANNIFAYCSYVSCFECPMNVAPIDKDKPVIVCLCNVQIVR